MFNQVMMHGLLLMVLEVGRQSADPQASSMAEECHVTLRIAGLSHSLDSAMLFLQEMQKKGGWEKISTHGRRLNQGDTGKLIRQLRERLNMQGIALTDGAVFDDAVLYAIKKFQCLHGLTPDGRLGKETLRELNINIEERIKIIQTNIQRASRLSSLEHEQFCIINIPAFMLHVFENKRPVMNSKVVVGKRQNQTAEFSAVMTEVVLNPFWDIPESILKKEILPEWRKDPTYLERNHMEWSGGNLRQRPGPDNALGKIKFLFPNPYHMYMHDTPARHLFEKENRAFSHGCIRVAEPMALASFVLRGTEWADEDKFQEALIKEETKRIPLHGKVHVQLVYLTAFVDEQGNLNFRRDLYQKQLNTLKMAKKQ